MDKYTYTKSQNEAPQIYITHYPICTHILNINMGPDIYMIIQNKLCPVSHYPISNYIN